MKLASVRVTYDVTVGALTMKTRVVLVLVAIFMTVSAFCQGFKAAKVDDAACYGGKLMGMPEPLRKLLNLTPAQDKQLKDINATYDAKLKAALAPSGPHTVESLLPIFQGRWRALFDTLVPKQKVALKSWVDAHVRGVK